MYQKGDVIYLGLWPQDGIFPSPIEWYVVHSESERVFLLSKKILFVKKYDGFWANSDLRIWLNNDFLNAAFNEQEKNNILETILLNNIKYEFTREFEEDNIKTYCDEVICDSHPTRDRVFIPDSSEIYTDFIPMCILENDPTPNIGHEQNHHFSWWLLRGQSTNDHWPNNNWESSITFMDAYGRECWGTVKDKYGVRPALWLKST